MVSVEFTLKPLQNKTIVSFNHVWEIILYDLSFGITRLDLEYGFILYQLWLNIIALVYLDLHILIILTLAVVVFRSYFLTKQKSLITTPFSGPTLYHVRNQDTPANI